MSPPTPTLLASIHRLADTIRHGDHSPEDRAALFDALEAMLDELIERIPPPPPPALVLFTRTRHRPRGNGDRYTGQP